MSLLKVIMTSAAVATTMFSGVASDVPAADVSVGKYAMAPEDDKAIAAGAGIYDAVRAALAESFDSGEPVLARHFWTADVLAGKTDQTLPVRPMLVKKQGSSKAAVTEAGADMPAASTAGNEIKTASVANGGNTGNNAAAANNGTAATMAAGNVNVPVLAGNTENLAVPVDNSSANVAVDQEVPPVVDGGNVSGNTDSNGSAPVPPAPVVQTPAPAVSDSSAAVASNTDEPTPVPVVPTPAPVVPDSNPADAGSSEAPAPAPVVSADNGPKYDHTTTIFTNDESTMLRVEYYDENNKLFEYSSVDNYDKDTNSYTETVYKWDEESDSQVTVRTDTYVNGELTSSEKY